MHTTIFTTFVAFSDSGKSFLIKEKQFGPEGGGSASFTIFNTVEKQYREFEITSDFGIGNGSTPQKIPKGKCKANLKKLRRSLKDQGFSGIDICPDCCETRDPDKCVSLSQSVLDINKQAFFATKQDKFVHPDFSIRVHDKELSLFMENKQLLAWLPEYTPEIKQMQAWLSPDNYQIVLFSFHQFNNHFLTDILCSDHCDGYERVSPKDFKQSRINRAF